MTCELCLFFIAPGFLMRVPIPRGAGFALAWLQAYLRHFPLFGACVGRWAASVFRLALPPRPSSSGDIA